MHKRKKSILIVDDDRNFARSLQDHLRSGEAEVLLAHTGQDCLARCREHSFDVVLLDQKLPDAEGPDLCPSILAANGQTKIIFTTAFPSFDNAVKAIRNGAFDYLSKPIELEELDLAVRQAFRTLDLEKVEQFQNYRSDREREETVLAGGSAAVAAVQRVIDLASQADAPVLITGETGSGKNVAARAVHFGGPLRHAPFVGINCAALPESLIEAELFGYEKGAFTGAAGVKKGMFEMAEGGTIFLDEIGEMPLPLQSKLLGVLDDGTFRRLGGTTALQAQVRVIAATGVDLEQAIRKRQFREDLYYRLGVIKLHIPPLRERKDDLEALCGHLIRKVAKGRQVRLADGELDRLGNYDWPGNVRELKNVIERAVILQHGNVLVPSEFLQTSSRKPQHPAPGRQAGERPATGGTGPLKPIEAMEKDAILAALNDQKGNLSAAARALGISLSTLRRRLKKYGLE